MTISTLLRKPTAILAALILFEITKSTFMLVDAESLLQDEYRLLHLAATLVVISFATAALFDWRPAVWIIGLYLLTFIVTILMALFRVTPEHLWTRALMLVIGGYFMFGGWTLLRHARHLPRHVPNKAL